MKKLFHLILSLSITALSLNSYANEIEISNVTGLISSSGKII